MKFRNILPVMLLAAKSLFIPNQQVACQGVNQDFNIAGLYPGMEIEFVDEEGKFNSSLDVILNKERKSGDLEFILNKEKIKHKFGLNFLINKDPVWSTINSGVKYSLDWIPADFVKQELKTYTGYQYVSSVEAPFLYSAGQFFTGGEENLSFILGNKKRANLETKGTLGGYVSLLNGDLVWDNYKAGYKISGTVPVSFVNFQSWLSQVYTKFNKDKYFFIDSSDNLNFGAKLGINLKELIAEAFFEKEYTFGKELNEEKIYTGINSLFKEAGINVRGNVRLNQTFPELFDFNFSIGKTVFEDRGYVELGFNLSENKPSLELRLKISPQNQDAARIIMKNKSKRLSPLIENQGYEKPSENFDEAIRKTDTLTEIGNVGNYFPYAVGLSPVRTPQQFFKDGYGDCDEIAWYRTHAARRNGYEDSWFVGYYDWHQNMGHAFFLVEDKDKRVYVTDNDHGVWLKLNVDENASKEEMAKLAVEQLSRYLALPLPNGNNYGIYLFDDNGVSPIYYNENLIFSSKDAKSPPIDTGLMSRVGRKPFY